MAKRQMTRSAVVAGTMSPIHWLIQIDVILSISHYIAAFEGYSATNEEGLRLSSSVSVVQCMGQSWPWDVQQAHLSVGLSRKART